MTTAGDEHPSTDQLAEFADGVADVPVDVRSHAATCDACQETLASFAAVRTALRAAPTAVATPPDVSARISAAIANAADQRAAEAARATELASGGPVAWFRRRLPRALAATASAAVIGLAGYAAVTNNPGDDGAGDTVANDAGDDDAAPQEAAPEAGSDDLEADGGALRDEASAESPLDTAVVDIWENPREFNAGCGSQIAAETGDRLVGSMERPDAVLVVLELRDADQLRGWVLPTCASLPAEAIDNVTVPVPPQ